MNPTQLAAQQLQARNRVQTSTPSTMSPETGPIPAGDLNHAGPDQASNAIYNALIQQTSTPSANPTQSQAPAQTGSVDYKELVDKGYSPTQIEGYLSENPGITLENAPENWDANISQSTIIPDAASVTETFGEMQPNVEVFSHGITTGTGLGVKVGTPLATPPGQWKVMSVYDQAKQKGFIGDSDGEGWGNNIVVQNQQTGESLRYSHLSQVDVAQGDSISGNKLIGLSGQSGNVTGPHLNIQYITPEGQPADILKSQYAPYIPIK